VFVSLITRIREKQLNAIAFYTVQLLSLSALLLALPLLVNFATMMVFIYLEKLYIFFFFFFFNN
jgi:hypothetical protein